MLNIPDTIPVRTRLPLAAWAVAAAVTLASVMSSLLHGPQPLKNTPPSAAQGLQPHDSSHPAKV